MNIKDIEYFNELITTKNFSIVAQNFNVSQPTITMAIKRLEKNLTLSSLFATNHIKN
ncbi:helix-turn-helix domain-containing protein [Ligilactobacillus aviarius]|uniref:helix-turn-helix domain-containing protein n=1 Tax=Ligilactobacillus aviarius TaxID=1606 RepID=UPI003D2F4538